MPNIKPPRSSSFIRHLDINRNLRPRKLLPKPQSKFTNIQTENQYEYERMLDDALIKSNWYYKPEDLYISNNIKGLAQISFTLYNKTNTSIQIPIVTDIDNLPNLIRLLLQFPMKIFAEKITRFQ